ncbi:MAG: preprotein translocase subunit SecE [Deltaproteobacteria bacterium]|nr:preprotein translocase subunit SecE [Deltaproteobacteria bacterium]
MVKIKLIISRIGRFLREAKVELKRVTWPTPKEALASTSVVIVVVMIVSLFLGIVDLGLTRIIRLVLG